MFIWADSGNVTDATAGWVVLASIASALVTALAAGAVSVIRARAETRTKTAQTVAELEAQKRKDTVGEWQTIVDRLQARADRQEEQLYAIHKELAECEKRSAEMSRENSQISGEVRTLILQVRRLQTITSDQEPATTTPSIITVTAQGTILSAVGGVTPLFHYLPQDLQRKNIEVLIPMRLKDQAMAAISGTIAKGTLPDPAKTILTHGLTKEGTEIPVAINCSGWITDKGDTLITAEIRRRLREEDSGVLSSRSIPKPQEKKP